MSYQTIAFIINSSAENLHDKAIAYLKKIKIPVDYKLEIINVDTDIPLMQAYNKILKQSTAKYKVYLPDSVLILNENFIVDILQLFTNKDIGMIGVAGAMLLPRSGEFWLAKRHCGKVYNMGSSIDSIDYTDSAYKGYWETAAVEKSVIITQYDLPWDESFTGSNAFYAAAQSLKFTEQGYKIIVPYQEQPWCLYLHNCYVYAGQEDFKIDQRNFFKNYQLLCAKRIINNNHKFFEFLKSLVVKEQEQLEKAKLISYTAYFAIANICGNYSDTLLEQEGIKLANTIKFPAFDKKLARRNTVLHVMTEAYNTGGHTRVVENWIRNDPNNQHFIIFTNPQSLVPTWLKEAAEQSGGAILTTEGTDLIAKSIDLYRQSLYCEHIVLHIHWHDIIPLLAYGNKQWQRKINLLNHADHLFWLGASIVDNVVNLHDLAKKICLERRGMVHHNYTKLMFPIASKQNTAVSSDEKNELRGQLNFKTPYPVKITAANKVITSMAPEWRFTGIANYDFPHFALEIVQTVPEAIFIVIGASGQRWEEIVKQSKGRVIPTGLLDRKIVDKVLKSSDIYVDSFYHSSGGCLADAFYSGLPVLSLNCDRVDWFNAGIPNYKSVEALKNDLLAFLRGEKTFDMNPAWQYLTKHCTKKAFFTSLRQVYAEKPHHIQAIRSMPLNIQEIDLFLFLSQNSHLRIGDMLNELSKSNRDNIMQQATKYVY